MDQTVSTPELRCYVLDGHTISLRPAPKERTWMDETGERFAYRCLPLNIANQHGWEILNRAEVTASWTGGDEIEALTVTSPSERPSAVSHFGFGVLTFHIPALFRTPPGYDLFVSGPINRVKHGIQPLTGIIETDWSTHNFTMNWKFTAPGDVTFDEGEPICMLFPVPRGMIETFEPVLLPLSDDPELEAANRETRKSRRDFLKGQAERDPDVLQQRWQKTYFRGPDAAVTPPHRTKVALREFAERSGQAGA